MTLELQVDDILRAHTNCDVSGVNTTRGEMFINDLDLWIDEQNLIGSSPNPSKWSTGNPPLETGIAILISRLLAQENSSTINQLKTGILNCKSANGLINKNPDRPDQITHDDLIGACVFPAGAEIVSTFVENHLYFSNTGSIYWDAIRSNLYRAYFKLAANKSPSFLELMAIYVYLWLFPANFSDLRLNWVILEVLKDKGHIWMYFYKVFIGRVKDRYGSVKNVLSGYYGNSDHVLVKWCPV